MAVGCQGLAFPGLKLPPSWAGQCQPLWWELGWGLLRIIGLALEPKGTLGVAGPPRVIHGEIWRGGLGKRVNNQRKGRRGGGSCLVSPGYSRGLEFPTLAHLQFTLESKTLVFHPEPEHGLLPNRNLGARTRGGDFFSHNSHDQSSCFSVCNGPFCVPSPADQSTGQMSDCPPVPMYIIITPLELLQNSTGVNKNRIWSLIYFH